MDRAPVKIPNLVEFLRREYYRRLGIYTVGGRQEFDLLFNFWKEYVSIAYKKLREEQREHEKIDKKYAKRLELEKLKRKDLQAYNREVNRQVELRNKKEEEEIRK